jgi:hypothetical protein
MALTAVLWRPGRRRRSARRVSPILAAPVDLESPEQLATDASPLRKQGAAAATNDRFLDLVVLISVLLFLVLAAGVGLLVLINTGLFPGLSLH